jgi:tRNA modification GTPase
MDSRVSARELPSVALIGPPNAGKSSLFNALVARYGECDREMTEPTAPALVSARPGTTRDYLTARIALGDLACELVDTAGVESDADRSNEPIDVAAQSLARKVKDRATVRVCCRDATDRRHASESQANELRSGGYELLALTKCDLLGREVSSKIDAKARLNGAPTIATSSVTSIGLEALCAAVRAAIMRETIQTPGSVVATTAERCHESVRLATSAIRSAEDLTMAGAGDEVVAAELRIALGELGKVVGAVYTDDLLERIFNTFCIGK